MREKDKEHMFGVMHDDAVSLIITCDAFSGEKIIGAILFEDTVFEREVLGPHDRRRTSGTSRASEARTSIDKGLEADRTASADMRHIPDLAHTLAKCGRFHEPYVPRDRSERDAQPRSPNAETRAAFSRNIVDGVRPGATDADLERWLARAAARAEPYARSRRAPRRHGPRSGSTPRRSRRTTGARRSARQPRRGRRRG